MKQLKEIMVLRLEQFWKLLRSLARSKPIWFFSTVMAAIGLIWPSNLHLAETYLDQMFSMKFLGGIFLTMSIAVGLNHLMEMLKSKFLRGLLIFLQAFTWLIFLFWGAFGFVNVLEADMDYHRSAFAARDNYTYYIMTIYRGAPGDIYTLYYRERSIAMILRLRNDVSTEEIRALGLDEHKIGSGVKW